MGNPHAVMIPYPAQGHVLPLMELSHCLVNRGFTITFINTEFIHKRVVDSLSSHDKVFGMIRFSSIPDGLKPEERNELGMLTTASFNYMTGKLEEIIRDINENSSAEDVVTCLIADGNMGWAFGVAEKMGIRRAAFWPCSATVLAESFSIQRFIDDGIIDDEGTPIISDKKIDIFPTMPVMKTASLPWNCIGDPTMNKIIFRAAQENNKLLESVERVICNSTFDLEPAAFTLFPKMLPIGPLLASNRLGGHSYGCFWQEDATCLSWLDQQPPRTVIYVAFGSFTLFKENQFKELALGLEHSGKRFLWVTRPNSSHPYPDGFLKRTGNRGYIVSWAPQQDVLRHPSVACFLSHCGWNSTMEGVGNGVPFLCWPYLADQFLNQDYICDVWKTGLRLDKDEQGIITRNEIMEKSELVFNDEEMRIRALRLMETVRASVNDGGQSSKNFKYFIEEMNS